MVLGCTLRSRYEIALIIAFEKERSLSFSRKKVVRSSYRNCSCHHFLSRSWAAFSPILPLLSFRKPALFVLSHFFFFFCTYFIMALFALRIRFLHSNYTTRVEIQLLFLDPEPYNWISNQNQSFSAQSVIIILFLAIIWSCFGLFIICGKVHFSAIEMIIRGINHE